MANRLEMAKIHSIQTLHARGWSQRRIARVLGVDREAVARDIRAAAACSVRASCSVTKGVDGEETEGRLAISDGPAIAYFSMFELDLVATASGSGMAPHA